MSWIVSAIRRGSVVVLAIAACLTLPQGVGSPAGSVLGDQSAGPVPSPAATQLPDAPRPTVPPPGALAGPAAPPDREITPGPRPGPVTQSPAEQPPNIVVIYLDDVNPHDGRLWSDPELTPTLHDLFVAHGISFPRAIAETPLCCPARGALLTGLHTHNHNVKVNHAHLFDPAEHLGRAMRRAGYASFWIGKYFNGTERFDAAQWARHSAGWTEFDVLIRGGPSTGSNSDYFNNYQLVTKQGAKRYGTYHSTRLIAEQLASRMAATPADKPIFAVLSIYNLHAPNTPMPLPGSAERCAGMPPWKPPSYNEGDVSDKPAYIRRLPLQPFPDGWPMTRYCEEMIGVDWAVEKVRSDLAAAGRLDNTLLVFTADNGMGWGEHRWGQKKRTPYATPVPLMMSWPARWGSARRVVDDIVVNIDLAPTFCELAGCTLGPFPRGHAGPDGRSMVRLLDGQQADMGRDAVLETSWGTLPWAAIRTTPSNPLGLWHYIVHPNGFVELYDLKADPWHLDNRASDPSLADLRRKLAARLAQLQREGLQGARPDGAIGLASTGPYKGNDVYDTSAQERQTARRAGVQRGRSYDFWVRLQNDGGTSGTFTVRATTSGSATIIVRYLAGQQDVTTQVSAGTYQLTMGAGKQSLLRMRMTVMSGSPAGAVKRAVIAFAGPGGTLVDVVRAVATR
jgi:N-acetylglucosamine-6-sulfatase